MLTKEQILSAPDLAREEVDVPEWGGSVIVRAMSATAYQETKGIGDRENMYSSILVKCLVDENDNLLFTEEDIVALGGKSFDVCDMLADKVLELSGLKEYTGKEFEKNSE